MTDKYNTMQRIKKLWILFVLVVAFFVTHYSSVLAAPIVPGSFSTTWRTNNPGVSSSTAIIIGVGAGTFNYNIYWEEVGNDSNNGSSTGHTGDITIDFPSAGTYRIDITGTFPSFAIIDVSGGGDVRKLLTVEQWGNNIWESMELAFYGATNVTLNASDVPDLSAVVSMQYMFAGATSFDQSINSWDVSNVTDMRGLFAGATSFNQPLNSWDVSQVTEFGESGEGSGGMFANATSFNQPLNNWDVSSATRMADMFLGATAFNQPLNSWDVSNVFSFSSMFYGASSFNQPLNNWNVSSVTTLNQMFREANSFNQSLGEWELNPTLTGNDMDNMLQNTAINISNYSATLLGWSDLAVVPESVNFVASPAVYCSTVDQARELLTGTYSWSITDAGSTLCYTLSYTAGTHATLIGDGSQLVIEEEICTYNEETEETDCVISGVTGTSVTVVPDAGYRFVKWSDESTANPRTDTGVTANISVTAILESTGSGTQTSSKRNTGSISSSQMATLMDRVQDLVAYIQDNQINIATLSPEDKQRFATLLQSIVAFLLVLLGEMG